MAATLPPALLQLQREIDATLDLVDAARERSRREEVPGWIWLRAARGCWLAGNVDWSTDFYKRAALSLTEYTLEVGRRTGTVEQYAHNALGAAWMCGDKEVLADCGRQIDAAVEQMLTNMDLPPEPLIRAGLLITRMRVSWYREQSLLIREYESELERRVNGLDAWSKAAWQTERGFYSHAAIKAMTAFRSPVGRGQPAGLQAPSSAAAQAMQALDRRLYELRARPACIGDLVDEELLSLAAAYKERSLPLPVLRLPSEPGTYGR